MFVNRKEESSQPELYSGTDMNSREKNDTTMIAATEVDIPAELPDGGLQAWLQVAAGFVLFFNSWGISSSYGVFQAYYETHLPDASVDAIAWIGFIQSFLLILVGVLVRPLCDAGYIRALATTGICLILLGFFAASFAARYWHVLLAQAFCVGLGAGCVFIPAVALVPQYFSRRRALATGVVTTGSSVGGVAYPVVFHSVLARAGFPWAARALAIVSLGTNAFALAVLRPRRRPGKKTAGRRWCAKLDLSAYRDRSFVLYSVAMFFNCWCYMAPIYYLQHYALSFKAPGQDAGTAQYLVAILNAGSVVGRIFPAWLAGRFGPINVLLGVSVCVSVVTLCWVAVRDGGAGSIAFAAMHGFASGGLTSLPATVVSTLVPDLGLHGTWLGMVSMTNAFASLSGPPIAGALLESTGGFLGVQLLSGLGTVVMTLFVAALRVSRVGKTQGWAA